MEKRFIIVSLTVFFLVINFVLIVSFQQQQTLESRAAVTIAQVIPTSITTPALPTFTCLGSCPISPTLPLPTDPPAQTPNNQDPTPCPQNQFTSNDVKANFFQGRLNGGLFGFIRDLIERIFNNIGKGNFPKKPASGPTPIPNPLPSNPPSGQTPPSGGNPCNHTPTAIPQATQQPQPTTILPSTAPTVRPTAAPTSAPSVGVADPLPPGNWTLVWSDDFNGTQLDRTKWDTNSTAYNPYNGFGGPECRSNPKDHKLNYLTDGENLSFSNGIMTITARRENRGGQPWTSGLITSGRTSGGACGSSEPSNGYIARKGDYIVKRAKMPAEIGAWGAFWTWGDGNANGEVDVYEYHSNNPRLLEISNRIAGGGCNHTMPNNLSENFHHFGAYLGANAVDFYVDGTKVCSGGPFASNGAALIAVLDISRGTYHPIPPANVNSMQMQIDSIRVYRQQ